MAIVRWEPFRDLVSVQDRLNRIFDEAFSGTGRGSDDERALGGSWAPAVDIFEHEGDLVLKAELPGVDPKDVDVHVENNVLTLFTRRIQEQGLRTYLFTYAPHYRTLSLSALAETFSLPPRTVTSIVSKMIWHEDLAASLDQSGGIIVLHRIESSRIQQLAQVLTEKLSNIVEQNEKTLDIKLGGSNAWGDRADAAKGEKRGEQAVGERRGRSERSARGELSLVIIFIGVMQSVDHTLVGGRGGRGARFAQGLGNRMPGATSQ